MLKPNCKKEPAPPEVVLREEDKPRPIVVRVVDADSPTLSPVGHIGYVSRFDALGQITVDGKENAFVFLNKFKADKLFTDMQIKEIGRSGVRLQYVYEEVNDMLPTRHFINT